MDVNSFEESIKRLVQIWEWFLDGIIYPIIYFTSIYCFLYFLSIIL